ncbi:MAG: hypothetical protein ACTHJ4_08460 [Candidatus Nucleicultricaceae bacterium]
MNFYNALLYTLLFSTVFSACHASKSSFADENEYPAIQTNQLSSNLQNAQKLEMTHLKKGMEHFTRGQYYDSNTFFERAIKINGSPLGYLYTSMMNFGNEKHRCFRIAKLSVASNALDEKTFEEHLKFLTQKKFKIPALSFEKKS